MRTKEYISAAYELMRSGVDVTTILKNLDLSLQKKGLTALHARILRGLIEKMRHGEHTLVPKVIVAREGDHAREKIEIEKALALVGGGTHVPSVDPSIVGGFIVIANGKRIDRSHKSTLLHVYHKLVD